MVTKFSGKFAIIMLKKHRKFCRCGLTHLDATPTFNYHPNTYGSPCKSWTGTQLFGHKWWTRWSIRWNLNKPFWQVQNPRHNSFVYLSCRSLNKHILLLPHDPLQSQPQAGLKIVQTIYCACCGQCSTYRRQPFPILHQMHNMHIFSNMCQQNQYR